jgi:hypothetical protein
MSCARARLDAGPSLASQGVGDIGRDALTSGTEESNTPHVVRSALSRWMASALGVLLLAGCGGSGSAGSSGRAVLRIGHDTISSAMVARWMSALAPGHEVPDWPTFERCVAHGKAVQLETIASVLRRECREGYAELEQRALDMLISSVWLTGEAREQGLPVAAKLVEGRLRSSEGSPIEGGEATPADRRLAVEAELAASEIERKLSRDTPQVTAAQIVAYYRSNLVRYRHPQTRVVYIVETIPSKQRADAIRQRVSSGRQDIGKIGFLERFPADLRRAEQGWAALRAAIFDARPGQLSSPVFYNHWWSFFRLLRIDRAHVDPLSRVRGAIEAKLTRERRRRATIAFVSAWRAKWRARTSCSAGYVVQKCRQFRGGHTREDPLRLS